MFLVNGTPQILASLKDYFIDTQTKTNSKTDIKE